MNRAKEIKKDMSSKLYKLTEEKIQIRENTVKELNNLYKENGINIGDKIEYIYATTGIREVGFFNGFVISCGGFIQPCISKIKKDGTPSKNTLTGVGVFDDDIIRKIEE